MKTHFSVGGNFVDVIFSWYGTEKYFVNSKLIYKSWSLSPRRTNEFKVGEHTIEIVTVATPKEYYCKVYKDGQLYIEELFPELKEKIEKRKKEGFRWELFFKQFFIWFFIGLIGVLLFNHFK